MYFVVIQSTKILIVSIHFFAMGCWRTVQWNRTQQHLILCWSSLWCIWSHPIRLSVDHYLIFGYNIKKRLLLRCIHHFKSDLINNMDHMRISGTSGKHSGTSGIYQFKVKRSCKQYIYNGSLNKEHMSELLQWQQRLNVLDFHSRCIKLTKYTCSFPNLLLLQVYKEMAVLLCTT